MMAESAQHGRIVRARDLVFRPDRGCAVATAVGPGTGADIIRLDVVKVPAATSWNPAESRDEENVVVVLAGSGTAASGKEEAAVGRADAVFTPTGDTYRLTAGAAEMTAYVWRTRLMPGREHGPLPARFSNLWQTDWQLRGFGGTGEVAASDRTAVMNFLFWPGTGTPQLCLHCGMMNPGEYFNVHTHPQSEEAFFAVEGHGQFYLADGWYDAAPGDVLFAPPGVPHGTRHHTDDPAAGRFATCGGPTPFDPLLYQRAGLSTTVR